jgi:DnaK suppressor protein
MNGSTNRTHASATAKDILGIDKTPAISSEWKTHYARLVQLREQMLSRKAHLVADAKEEQPVYGEHIGEAGTDQYDQDFALSMISADQQAIYEIDEALSRIRNGSYGTCELTGLPIEPERLEAIPWARFRVDAQRELERNGSVSLTKFGKVGKLSSEFGSADNESAEEEND